MCNLTNVQKRRMEITNTKCTNMSVGNYLGIKEVFLDFKHRFENHIYTNIGHLLWLTAK